jgi:hypothetical protein
MIQLNFFVKVGSVYFPPHLIDLFSWQCYSVFF